MTDSDIVSSPIPFLRPSWTSPKVEPIHLLMEDINKMDESVRRQLQNEKEQDIAGTSNDSDDGTHEFSNSKEMKEYDNTFPPVSTDQETNPSLEAFAYQYHYIDFLGKPLFPIAVIQNMPVLIQRGREDVIRNYSIAFSHAQQGLYDVDKLNSTLKKDREINDRSKVTDNDEIDELASTMTI